MGSKELWKDTTTEGMEKKISAEKARERMKATETEVLRSGNVEMQHGGKKGV